MSISFSLSLSPLSLFLQSLASMTSTQVKVNRALSVPPVPFDLPLAANHRASVTIAPPSAHIGATPVQMRLISYDLREGQVLQSLFCSLYSGTLENLRLYAKLDQLLYLLCTCLTLLPCSLSKYLLCDLVYDRFPPLALFKSLCIYQSYIFLKYSNNM